METVSAVLKLLLVDMDNLTGVFLPLFIAHAPEMLYNSKKNYMTYFLQLHY